jgi:hypothetical protein
LRKSSTLGDRGIRDDSSRDPSCEFVDDAEKIAQVHCTFLGVFAVSSSGFFLGGVSPATMAQLFSHFFIRFRLKSE